MDVSDLRRLAANSNFNGLPTPPAQAYGKCSNVPFDGGLTLLSATEIMVSVIYEYKSMPVIRWRNVALYTCFD